jgi:Flp pilus assembly protein TadG
MKWRNSRAMRKKTRNLWQIITGALKRRRKFARDQRGVTLIEFGLLALPFFAIIGAILETGIIFLASQILDSALADSSRIIRTGQAEAQSFTATEYRAAICEGLYGMFDCNALKVKVTEVADFSSATLSPVADPDDGAWLIVESYNDGVGSSFVMVEAYYKWPVLLNLYDFNLSNLPDGTRLLSSVRVFRNEPF